MRKFVALALVALLSLSLALAVVGCGNKQSSESATPEASPMTMGSDTSSSMSADTSAIADTSMKHH
jgi:hypothetical protein